MKKDKINRIFNLLEKKGLLDENMPKISVIQLVGDRDNPSISMKDYAFTIPANPMSDRGQMILEVVEAKEDN